MDYHDHGAKIKSSCVSLFCFFTPLITLPGLRYRSLEYSSGSATFTQTGLSPRITVPLVIPLMEVSVVVLKM